MGREIQTSQTTMQVLNKPPDNANLFGRWNKGIK